jgi:cytochrome d ubiquinol oxidase subunit I
MNPIPYYPYQDFGPIMKGMIIGGVGILHVFLAQFAIGGGMLMCYFQYLTKNGKHPFARHFLDSYFRWLILFSFVLGALTGVGLWFTSIQISPRTIGVMVSEFHWIWAVEYTFFWLEIVAGYLFYRYANSLSDNLRMMLLVLYTTGGWFSLFWINGILAWQLTPGKWGTTHNVWHGFFNPGFWPSLIYRTVTSMTIAALMGCIVINRMTDLDRAARQSLIHRVSHFLAPLAAMPFLGIWYVLTMPQDSRSWILGGSPAMTMFLSLSVITSMMIGLYAFFALIQQKLYVSGPTATLLCGLAFLATAGGEFVREGARKPYTVRQALYANSLTQQDIDGLRKTGSAAQDPYPLRSPEQYPNDQVRIGMKVFQHQCSVCHTVNGANGLTHLMHSWTLDQSRINIAMLQHTKSFMPPFAGTANEVEAFIQMISWIEKGRPTEWPLSNDPKIFSQIQIWLDKAGTLPKTEPSTFSQK